MNDNTGLRRLAAALLSDAAREFGNHGCNDCDHAAALSDEDAAHLARVYDLYNLGSAERVAAQPDERHTPAQMKRAADFILMSACAEWLRSPQTPAPPLDLDAIEARADGGPDTDEIHRVADALACVVEEYDSIACGDAVGLLKALAEMPREKAALAARVRELEADVALQGDALLRWREATGCETPHAAREMIGRICLRIVDSIDPLTYLVLTPDD